MTSEAAVMSKPVSRGTPLILPPRPMTVSRSARSFMSSTRRNGMSRWSIPRALPWWRWLSTIAASRLCARGDGREVAGEVEVDVLHGHDLRVPAAGRAALHAEAGPERRLAQRDDRSLAEAVERLPEADRRRRLALARGRRRDRRDEHQRRLGPALARGRSPGCETLALSRPYGMKSSGSMPAVARDLLDRAKPRLLGDLDVGLHVAWHPSNTAGQACFEEAGTAETARRQGHRRRSAAAGCLPLSGLLTTHRL